MVDIVKDFNIGKRAALTHWRKPHREFIPMRTLQRLSCLAAAAGSSWAAGRSPLGAGGACTGGGAALQAAEGVNASTGVRSAGAQAGQGNGRLLHPGILGWQILLCKVGGGLRRGRR